MSLISSEKTDGYTWSLSLKIDADVFAAAMVKSYSKNRRKYNVPGFRPGKAPMKVIERLYTEKVFYDDAFEDVFPAEYQAAVSELSLEPVDRPHDFDIKVMSSAEGVELTCLVTVKPELTIGSYKGLAGYSEPVEVTDEEVDAEISRLREQNAREMDVEDRAAAENDIAVIDFDGYIDGKQFEGGKGEDHELTLGSHQFIEGFEEQIVGHNSGDEFDVNVTFPDDYAEELAGKKAVFKVKLKNIRTKQLPDLDDEFAKDVSEFDTLDELKADTKKTLTDKKQKDSDSKLESSIYDSLLKVVTGDIPACMIDEAVDRSVEQFDYRLRSQGMDIQSYLGYLGMDMDGLRGSMRPRAERDVRLELALAQIAKAEDLAASDEEIEAKYEDIAKEVGMETDVVKERVGRDAIAEEIIRPKVYELLKGSAEISDKKPEPEKDEDAKDDEQVDEVIDEAVSDAAESAAEETDTDSDK